LKALPVQRSARSRETLDCALQYLATHSLLFDVSSGKESELRFSILSGLHATAEQSQGHFSIEQQIKNQIA
jgi:hypothetical protein